MSHFVATTEKTTAEGLARLFRDNVWKLHGLPESVISDRGPQFTAGMTRELNKMLGIKTKLSIAYHPETDGQTERTNQELEQYLRMYVNHRQNNCVKIVDGGLYFIFSFHFSFTLLYFTFSFFYF